MRRSLPDEGQPFAWTASVLHPDCTNCNSDALNAQMCTPITGCGTPLLHGLGDLRMEDSVGGPREIDLGDCTHLAPICGVFGHISQACNYFRALMSAPKAQHVGLRCSPRPSAVVDGTWAAPARSVYKGGTIIKRSLYHIRPEFGRLRNGASFRRLRAPGPCCGTAPDQPGADDAGLDPPGAYDDSGPRARAAARRPSGRSSRRCSGPRRRRGRRRRPAARRRP